MNNFIITPMAFLGNTFFPLDHLPGWLQVVLNLLPLAHASKAIRASAFQQIPDFQDYLILFISGCLAIALAIRSVNHARD
jgi:ABC-type multidrug transport system permease subunit